MSNSAFTPTVLTVAATAGSGSGQGELNIVTNPSAVTDILNWTAVGVGLSLTRDASGSPLDPVVPTGFNLSASATSQTVTSASLTVPETLRNKKLKLEFYYKYVSGSSFIVDVLDGSAVQYALSTDVSGTTTLAQTNGKFVCYIDTNSTSSLQVKLTSTGAGVMKMTQVIVGPGIQPQGAVVGEWTSYTPTISGLTSSYTIPQAEYRRVGSSVQIRGRLNATAAGTGSSNIGWSLPAGLTPVPTPASSTANVGFGDWYDVVSNNDRSLYINYATSLGTSLLFSPTYNTTSARLVGTNMGNGSVLFFTAEVLVAEWAGSGTVQLAQNDVEYAWSTDGTTTAGATQTDNGLYGYGPSGTSFVSVDSNTANNQTRKRVRFQTPIQPGDVFTIEINRGDNLWLPVPNSNGPSSVIWEGTGRYGIGYERISGSNTDIYVAFGNGGGSAYKGTAKTYGELNTDPWGGYTSAKWRVRKSSAGAAVGFGIVNPGSSAGLVSASGLPGNTTGNVIASGFVGEVVTGTMSTATASGVNSAATGGTLSGLSKGLYMLYGMLPLRNVTRPTAGKVASYVSLTNSTNSTTIVAATYVGAWTSTATGGDNEFGQGMFAIPYTVPADSTTLLLRFGSIDVGGATGTPTCVYTSSQGGYFYAVRIA